MCLTRFFALSAGDSLPKNRRSALASRMHQLQGLVGLEDVGAKEDYHDIDELFFVLSNEFLVQYEQVGASETSL